MKPKINPLIDCVFKAILGSEKNKNLLIHFLNAVLELEKGKRIDDVIILNPYNEREFTGDKLSVVDVKAKDEKGSIYQVEVQLALHPDIKARMLYTWSSIYRSQIQKGQDYEKLKPTISIWIFDKNLFTKINSCHLPFTIYNIENNLALSDHLQIHVIQLPKWKLKGAIRSEKDRWFYLLKQGRDTDLENPPEILNTNEMRQVMQVLKDFSENQKNYLLYQSRLDAVRKENAISKTNARLKRMEKEKQKAEEKIKSLMQLLKQKGIEVPEEDE